MTRILSIADGFSSPSSPVVSPTPAFKYVEYISESAFETAYGSPQKGHTFARTSDGAIRYYNGSAWVTISPGSGAQVVTNNNYQHTITGADILNGFITIPFTTISPSKIVVSIVGCSVQKYGSDYTISGNVLTFIDLLSELEVDDVLVIINTEIN